MTNKTFLQSKIEEQAAKRLEKDIKEIRGLLLKNPILSELSFNYPNSIYEKVDVYGIRGFFLIGPPSSRDCFFSEFGDEVLGSSNRENCKDKTNFEEICEKLLEKYIKEEGDLLLENLGILTDYLK